MALLTALPTVAQDALKFGYLSYSNVLQAMPEYATMQSKMAELRQKYEAEQQRVEEDFNKKYEEFLDGQKSFPKTILQKRQSELQEMLDKNVAFKKESQRLLTQAEEDAIAPIKVRLSQALDAIKQVGAAGNYVYIMDLTSGIPYISTTLSTDVTADVKKKLGL